MAHTVEFERCVDFLARMIEKYGSETPSGTEWITGGGQSRR